MLEDLNDVGRVLVYSMIILLKLHFYNKSMCGFKLYLKFVCVLFVCEHVYLKFKVDP